MLENLFKPEVILVRWPVFLFSLSLHEFLHGWTAWRLGDPTARDQGRLTLNPLAHYDLVGTTCGLLFHIGWAKPVPVNPAFFRSPRRDDVLVSAGGPASNFALALVFAVVFKALQAVDMNSVGGARNTLELVEKAAAYGVFLNLVLGVFNLFPVFPLDGFHILQGLLSRKAAQSLEAMKPYSFLILLALVVLGRGLIMGPVFYAMDLAFTDSEHFRLLTLVKALL